MARAHNEQCPANWRRCEDDAEMDQIRPACPNPVRAGLWESENQTLTLLWAVIDPT